ncbi:hypothetical protein NL676_008912 [Syzygium grande]|nr:hypothetical protein NL676_008912 [Syzygium grande]
MALGINSSSWGSDEVATDRDGNSLAWTGVEQRHHRGTGTRLSWCSEYSVGGAARYCGSTRESTDVPAALAVGPKQPFMAGMIAARLIDRGGGHAIWAECEKRTAYTLVAVGSATSPSPHGRRLRLVAVASISWLLAPPCGCGLRSSPSAPPRHLRHVAVGSAITDMFNKSQLFQR